MNQTRNELLNSSLDRAAQQNAIRVHLGPTGWNATYTGPHAAEIVELFGTATIPTAFTAQCPLGTVLAHIEARNPGVAVFHWTSTGHRSAVRL